jgi:sugar lactone lactonase YvrE
MPNGDLLIVAAGTRKLLRHGATGLGEYADLSALAPQGINDMAVDRAGRAYVGEMRYDSSRPLQPQPSNLFLVQPDGSVEIAAEKLLMANGAVISADGRTLIIAETLGSRLSAFDIADDGRLANRRVFAQLPAGYFPDGIALDSAGGIWAACPGGPGVVRVEQGGRITDTLAMRAGYNAYACTLGGAERSTLYVCTATTHDQARLRALCSSRIERIAVGYTGVGLS